MEKLQRGSEGMQSGFVYTLSSRIGILGSVLKRLKRNKQNSMLICTLIYRNKINCNYHLIY